MEADLLTPGGKVWTLRQCPWSLVGAGLLASFSPTTWDRDSSWDELKRPHRRLAGVRPQRPQDPGEPASARPVVPARSPRTQPRSHGRGGGLGGAEHGRPPSRIPREGGLLPRGVLLWPGATRETCSVPSRRSHDRRGTGHAAGGGLAVPSPVPGPRRPRRAGTRLLRQLIGRCHWRQKQGGTNGNTAVHEPLRSGRGTPAQASVTEQRRAVAGALGTGGAKGKWVCGGAQLRERRPTCVSCLLSPQFPARGLASTSSRAGRSHPRLVPTGSMAPQQQVPPRGRSATWSPTQPQVQPEPEP